MGMNNPDQRLDRLYQLLPAVYRLRDAREGYPLQSLLRVIAEQVNIVEDDIAQLYENWFIETADDWAVPYLGDLIGYRPALEAGEGGAGTTQERQALSRVLVPRREVSNTIRYRRRKGTLALLEELSMDVSGWPARAVEFFKLLGWNQNIDHSRFDRARTADLRAGETLDLVDGPFDPLAHTVDVRRVNSHRTPGRYNLPSIGLFVWRLKSYSVTNATAFCAEDAGPNCYTFSALGHDAPLFIQPEPGIRPAHIDRDLNVPQPVRRHAFARHPGSYYGKEKSLAIWVDGWAGLNPLEPVPLTAIIPANLSDWQYEPHSKHIAVDPELGRFVFPPSQLPKKGVRVTYRYGFSWEIGGGEYPRALLNPTARPATESGQIREFATYRVGHGEKFRRIGEALHRWGVEKPDDAVIELSDSRIHVEPIYIELGTNQTLQLRATEGARPVISLLDRTADLPDALAVKMSLGSRFTMDGLLITGRAVHVYGKECEKLGDQRDPICGAHLIIRHCTLVPGWGLEYDCQPKRTSEPSLELHNVRANVRVEHSIVGSIHVHEDEVKIDPIPLYISDCFVDATDPEKEALGAPGCAVAHAVLTIRRTTVFGILNVHAIDAAEDCIFNDGLNVARRQLGCLRFCYVPAGCRTPRRYRCQPDLVAQALTEQSTAPERSNADSAAQRAGMECERLRIQPSFTSIRYGHPGYGQLALTCADEIKRGAHDESEMGAFHDNFEPLREANLLARLEEYTAAGMNVGLIFST
jgi:hypothetical protein